MSATLNIASGLHRGAALELGAREYVLGSGEDCDIVLRDASLAPRQCLLKQSWFGFALHDLRDDTAPIIKPQSSEYRGTLIDVTYDIGGVTITLSQHSAAEPAVSSTPRWFTGSALAAGLVVAIVAFAANREVAEPAAGASAQPANASRATLDTAVLEQVRNTFAADDLRISLQDGTLSIVGQTPHLDVKQRIHSLAEDLRGVVAVRDGVTYLDANAHPASPGPFPVKLRGVMVGNPSYFLTDRGARYFVGGVLPDGAEIMAIESTRIRLQIGGRDVIYSLE